jgi:tryptophan synthase alpha chain
VSRLSAKFQVLKQEGRKALIPFLTAGDPHPDFTVPAMHALVQAGADILELGVPFSDPMADGPVIQKASERALVHKMSLRRVLEQVRQFRQEDRVTPIVLMGYLNPIECLGYEVFVERASGAGVDGVLTVDWPPEESADLLPLLKQAELDPIFLVAPNSTKARIRQMGKLGSGYLYYVSLKGVTGASHLDLADVERKLTDVRGWVDLPVGVGFGVKDAETAASIARFADAVVVGSALVSRIAAAGDEGEALDEIVLFLKTLRTAMDAPV